MVVNKLHLLLMFKFLAIVKCQFWNNYIYKKHTFFHCKQLFSYIFNLGVIFFKLLEVTQTKCTEHQVFPIISLFKLNAHIILNGVHQSEVISIKILVNSKNTKNWSFLYVATIFHKNFHFESVIKLTKNTRNFKKWFVQTFSYSYLFYIW